MWHAVELAVAAAASTGFFSQEKETGEALKKGRKESREEKGRGN